MKKQQLLLTLNHPLVLISSMPSYTAMISCRVSDSVVAYFFFFFFWPPASRSRDDWSGLCIRWRSVLRRICWARRYACIVSRILQRPGVMDTCLGGSLMEGPEGNETESVTMTELGPPSVHLATTTTLDPIFWLADIVVISFVIITIHWKDHPLSPLVYVWGGGTHGRGVIMETLRQQGVLGCSGSCGGWSPTCILERSWILWRHIPSRWSWFPQEGGLDRAYFLVGCFQNIFFQPDPQADPDRHMT